MVRWAVVLGMLLAAAVEGVAAGSTHVVVPCYNEVERLPRAEFLAYASDPANANVFFTFVNDGSKDGTLGVLKILAAAHPKNLFVLDLAKNGGKAEAVRQGINHVMTVEPHPSVSYSPRIFSLSSQRMGMWDGSQLDWYLSFVRSFHHLTSANIAPYRARHVSENPKHHIPNRIPHTAYRIPTKRSHDIGR